MTGLFAWPLRNFQKKPKILLLIMLLRQRQDSFEFSAKLTISILKFVVNTCLALIIWKINLNRSQVQNNTPKYAFNNLLC